MSGCFMVLVYVAAELALLGALARMMGPGRLLLFLIVKGVLAWTLVGWVGKRGAQRAALAMAQGKPLEHETLRDAASFFGLFVLSWPAPLANLFGLLLLFPPTRALLAWRLRARFERALRSGRFVVVNMGGGGVPPGPASDIIDVEAEEHPPDESLPPPKLGDGK